VSVPFPAPPDKLDIANVTINGMQPRGDGYHGFLEKGWYPKPFQMQLYLLALITANGKN